MALIHSLQHGALADWFAARTPGADEVALDVATAAASRRPVRPAPGTALGSHHWAKVGSTFGARLGAVVEAAPPYFGLLGLIAADLISTDTAHAIAAASPSHAALSSGRSDRALDFRPTPSGWRDLDQPWPPAEPRGWVDKAATDLAARTRDYHSRHAPTGSIGTEPVERGLARTYGFWSAAEDLYRSGTIGPELEVLLDVDEPTVEHLRAFTPDAVVHDAAQIVQRLHDSGSLELLHDIAGKPASGAPLGHAAPVLVTHWADADLLVGDTLIEVKTVMRAEPAPKVVSWLRQLLAYAWLDPADRYRIRHVALYLSRHGVLIRWTVDDLAARLLATPHSNWRGLVAARDDFLRTATACARRDGAIIDP